MATKQLTYWQKKEPHFKTNIHPQLQNNETYKTKNTTEILRGSHRLIQQDTVAKHQIHMGK
jgi:hypothetical protein